MGLNLLPRQFIHQTKASALQNKKMHVTKPLPVNLAISGEDLLHDFLSAFPSKKVAPPGGPTPEGQEIFI